jgi:hypothetical protein
MNKFWFWFKTLKKSNFTKNKLKVDDIYLSRVIKGYDYLIIFLSNWK